MQTRSLRLKLFTAVVGLVVTVGLVSAETARLASIDVVHIDKTTVLRVTANGPIVWREASGLSTAAALSSPLHLKIYGLTLAKTGTGASQEMTTELGKLRLEADENDNILLTLTAGDSRAYRVRFGLSANVLEILSE